MDLQKRVDRLERQNRWLKGVVTVALVAIGVIPFLGEPRPARADGEGAGVVKATEFLLVDGRGNTCMTIRNKDGVTMFEIRDSGEKNFVGLVASATDGYFYAISKDGQKVTLGTDNRIGKLEFLDRDRDVIKRLP